MSLVTNGRLHCFGCNNRKVTKSYEPMCWTWALFDWFWTLLPNRGFRGSERLNFCCMYSRKPCLSPCTNCQKNATDKIPRHSDERRICCWQWDIYNELTCLLLYIIQRLAMQKHKNDTAQAMITSAIRRICWESTTQFRHDQHKRRQFRKSLINNGLLALQKCNQPQAWWGQSWLSWVGNLTTTSGCCTSSTPAWSDRTDCGRAGQRTIRSHTRNSGYLVWACRGHNWFLSANIQNNLFASRWQRINSTQQSKSNAEKRALTIPFTS